MALSYEESLRAEGAAKAWLMAGVLLTFWGFSAYVWEHQSEWFSPFVIEHNLNMGSTYNMIDSLSFVKFFAIVVCGSTATAGAVLARQISKL